MIPRSNRNAVQNSSEPGYETARRFFPGTGSTYDAVVDLFTFTCDRQWKKKIAAGVPGNALHILDQACGTGILTLKLARRFPKCRIVGVDMCAEYIRIAQRKAAANGLVNVDFVLGRAEQVRLKRDFDAITSSYLAKHANAALLADNLSAMLRNGGVAILHDFTYPPNRWIARSWEFYLKILKTLGPRIYPSWKAAFYGLADLTRNTKWVPEITTELKRRGFDDVSVNHLTLGTAALVTARRTGRS